MNIYLLEISGVYKEENQGIIAGSKYLEKNSNASSLDGGPMDYTGSGTHGIDISGVTFYVTQTRSGTVAHNGYNFGNFLWGAGANALGVPEWLAKLGAHYNNYVNDPYHKGKLDSKDDQYSIQLGYEWVFKTEWGKKLEKHFEELKEKYNRETNGVSNFWELWY